MTTNTSQEGTPGLPKQLLLIPDQLGTKEREKLILSHYKCCSLQHMQRCLSSSIVSYVGQHLVVLLVMADGAQPARRLVAGTHGHLSGQEWSCWLSQPRAPLPQALPWHAEGHLKQIGHAGLSSAMMLALFLEKAHFQFTALLRN